MTNEELMQLFLKQQAEELAEIRQIQKLPRASWMNITSPSRSRILVLLLQRLVEKLKRQKTPLIMASSKPETTLLS